MDLNKFIQQAGNRAAFYGRHSTDDQDMSMQIAAAERFCKKYNCKIIEYYEDKGVSARRVPWKERKELARLIHDVINEDKFDFIIAYADNRLARDPVEHVQLRVLLEGIPIILCNTESLYNPEHGDLLSQVIRDGASKFEIDQTMERTRDTFVSKISRGERIGGPAPWGYTKLETGVTRKQKPVYRYKPLPECIPTIRSIYKWYSRGDGFRAIAERLGWQQISGVPNKERVKSIIINPFYAGYVSMYRVKSESRLSVREIRDWHIHKCTQIEPVVTYEEWWRCFEVYQNKVKDKTAPRLYKTSFLLTGILRCDDCHVFLKGKNQIKRVGTAEYGRRTYSCPKCSCTVDATEVEHDVLQHVYNHALVLTDRDWSRMEAEMQKNLNEEMDRLQSIEVSLQEKVHEGNRLLNTSRRILADIIDCPERDEVKILEDYRAVIRNQNEQAELQEQTFRQYGKLLQKASNHASQIRSIRMDQIHDTGRRRLILELVESVTYAPSSRYIAEIKLRVNIK